MTLVRATASLPDLDTGQEADVDSWDPRWANRIASGLVVVVQPEPDATVPVMPDPPSPRHPHATASLAELVHRMTVNDVLHAVDTGRLDAADVLAVEREGKQRSSLIDALTEGEPDAG